MLRRRKRVVEMAEFGLLPSPEFEPPAEALVRFAAQIGRIRAATRGRAGKRRSLRVTVRSVGEGQCLMTMTVPTDAARTLRAAMYTEVEVRPISEVLSELGVCSEDGADPQVVVEHPDPAPLVDEGVLSWTG